MDENVKMIRKQDVYVIWHSVFLIRVINIWNRTALIFVKFHLSDPLRHTHYLCDHMGSSEATFWWLWVCWCSTKKRWKWTDDYTYAGITTLNSFIVIVEWSHIWNGLNCVAYTTYSVRSLSQNDRHVSDISWIGKLQK